MTDQEIINWIKEGKEGKALQKLYQFYGSVQKFLCNNGASKEEALDVYQDALYILCKKIMEGKFELSSKLSTYLFSVSKFIWKDELVKKNKVVNLSFDLNEDELEEQEAVRELELKNTMAEKALLDLGEKCLEILKAFYHQGLKMEKIAEVFGFSSEKSAKNQKYKCLEKAKLKYSELSKNSSTEKI